MTFTVLGRTVALVATVSLGLVFPAWAAQPVSGTAMMSLSGKMPWTMTCDFDRNNGDTNTISRRGRGLSSTSSMVARRILGGNCTVEVSDKGRLKVTFDTSRGVDCPFEMKDGRCVAVFGPGENRFSVG